MGDGGSGNDPGNRALNPNNLHGKMLRIDVNSDGFPADAERDYAIPADNPFATSGGLPEIWAVGLRNPWRWSFDRLLGNLWIADVGQGLWEEINVVPGNGGPGRNYGWRVREGLASTGLSAGGFSIANLTDPVYVYSHGNGTTQGFSVTGGYVYRGSIRPWRGRYFFTDYVNSRIWSAEYVDGVWTDFQDYTTFLSNLTTGAISSIASFGEDADGELYIVQLNGRVRKLVPQGTLPCPADYNLIGGVSVQDVFDYLTAWQSRQAGADHNADQRISVQDVYDFLTDWTTPCP
jgi:glucose/arabinose dehydrogenase